MHLLIYNPVSGNSGDELKKITDLFQQYDVELKVVETSLDTSINEVLSIHYLDLECIVVAGGDGTISQVIDGIVLNNLDCNLLIYPRGTTNEYATNLSITKDVLESYLKGDSTVICVDVGVYNDTNFFTYSFIFGNFSHITYETPQWLKNRLGYVAYWIYGIASLYILKLKSYQMTFKFNNKTVSDKFLFGSVSNSDTLGKVIHLKDVSFKDGLLELFLIRVPRSFKEVRGFLYDSRTGKNTSNLIIEEKVERVEVSSPNKHSWSADGEFSGKFNELTIEVKQKGIRIIT